VNLFILTARPFWINRLLLLINNNIGQYILGSFLMATIMAVTFGLLGYVLMTFFGANKNIKNA
jgi:hypothetical protein